MKSSTYNINTIFTFENVCLHLNKFWIDEIKMSIKSKVWLTIIIYNTNNKSATIIRNLPFNTSDFSDVIIVIKQTFESKRLFNKKDILNKIVFQFKLENSYSYNYTWKRILLKKWLVYVLTILGAILITYEFLTLFLEVNQVFNFEKINDDILDIATKTINTFENHTENINNVNSSKEVCIFDSFIKLFNNTNKDYQYYPSYFLPNPLKVDNTSFNMLEYILFNQYVILEYTTRDINVLISRMNDIIPLCKIIKNNVFQ